MMKDLKRIIPAVIASALIFGGCGSSASEPAKTESPAESTVTESSKAETSEPAVTEAAESKAEESEAAVPTEVVPGEIPAAFDPRPDGVSAVREQQWANCWDFGGISTLESCLIRAKLADTSVDLSEEDVLWWANANEDGGWMKVKRDDPGYAPMLTGYLETVGARSEADIPYFNKPEDMNEANASMIYETGDNVRPANYDTAPVVYEVTDTIYLMNQTPEEIKELILTYGAVTNMFYEDPACFNEETSSYWFPGEEGHEANHCISVIGWDDNYSKDNFLEIDGKKPEADGAWLIKNSYGTEYGSDGGYMYISYEDEYIFHPAERQYTYTVAGARKPVDQKRYYLDEFGAVSSWTPENDGKAVFANVYEFGAGEKFNELSFVTWAKGAQYEAYYAPMDGEVPSADESTWVKLSSGTVEHNGYMTVKADAADAVPEGKGAVILTLEGAEPCIGTDEHLLHYGRPLFNGIITENVSFYLADGAFVPAITIKTRPNGEDTYEETLNLCIRAYTVPES